MVNSSLRSGWFDATLLFASAAVSFFIIAGLVLAPKREAEGIAVIFAPWTSAADTMTRVSKAGARFVRFGAFEFIAVIEPAAGQHIRARGAWFFADPAMLAACLKPIARNKS